MVAADPILRRRPVQPAVFAPLRDVAAPDDPIVPVEPPPDFDALRAEAQEAGYADGFEFGRQAGEYALHVQAERLRGLLDVAAHDVQNAVRQLEPLVVELALIVAGRIVENEIAACPLYLRDVLRSALAAAGNVKVVRVRVHPEDHELVDAGLVSDLSFGVEIVADPGVARGGCIVDTAAGFVEAQPEERLAELRRQILAGLGVAT